MRKCRVAVGEVLRLHRYVFIWGCRPGDPGHRFWGLYAGTHIMSPVLFKPIKELLRRGARMDVAQLSGSRHKEHHMKGDHARHAYLTDVICSVRQVAFSFRVCARARVCETEKWASSLGLITLTHLVAFVVACFGPKVQPGMFLIQSCRLHFQFLLVSVIL